MVEKSVVLMVMQWAKNWESKMVYLLDFLKEIVQVASLAELLVQW